MAEENEGMEFHRRHIIPNLKKSFVSGFKELREGIKEFSDWPTIPQLYLKGEFLGGCDIVKEMYESGELQKKLAEKSINYKKK